MVKNMVEETTQSNRPRSKMARPKPVYLWTVGDVLKWYRRHCSEYLELFSKVRQKRKISIALNVLTDSRIKLENSNSVEILLIIS